MNLFACASFEEKFLEEKLWVKRYEPCEDFYIQKPVMGGKVTILAAGTRKLPLATIPLCKVSGTKEEEMWSNPFGGFKKKKKKVSYDNEGNSSQFFVLNFKTLVHVRGKFIFSV